uniref:hypothetical protein n=1 Tax=Aciditerrimonas ferrireducens TaxID=667306 RepID=UPI0036732C01
MSDDVIAQILRDLLSPAAHAGSAAPHEAPLVEATSTGAVPRAGHRGRRAGIVLAGGAASLVVGAWIGGAWQGVPPSAEPLAASGLPVVRPLAGASGAAVLRAADVAALAPLPVSSARASRASGVGHQTSSQRPPVQPRISTGTPLSGGSAGADPRVLPEVTTTGSGSASGTSAAPPRSVAQTDGSGSSSSGASSSGSSSSGSSTSAGTATSSSSGLAGALGSTVSGLVQGVTGTVGSVVGSVTQGLSGVLGSTGSSSSAAGSAAGTTSTNDPASGSGSSAAGQAVASVGSAVGGLVQGVTGTLGSLLGGL